jgi:hypothetical protein
VKLSVLCSAAAFSIEWLSALWTLGCQTKGPERNHQPAVLTRSALADVHPDHLLRFNLPIPAHRMMYGRQLAVCRAARILGTNAEPLCTEMMALTQSPVGSIRHEALEALFLASTNSLLPLAINTMVKDPFVDCRIAAMRYVFAFGADPKVVVGLAIGNIGKSIIRYPDERGRLFAETLKQGARPKVLEDAFSKLSHSTDPEVRRFLAKWGSVCLSSNVAFIEILERLAKDTNLVVARAATSALTDTRRLK